MQNILGNPRRSASDIYAEMEKTIFAEADRKRSLNKSNIMTSRKVYDLVCSFLTNNHMVNSDVNVFDDSSFVGLESFNGDADFARLGESSLDELVEQAEIPEDLQPEAMKAVAVLLAKMKACSGKEGAELFRNQHFNKASRNGINTENLKHSTNTVFAPSLQNVVTQIGIPSQESFGANVDKVLPDIRASLAVTLLQFHRGLMDRIMHRRTSASPYIKYVVPYSEVYDMLKSNDKDHKVRNEGDHIIPFIELYGDPRSVSNQLTPIIPLASNDTEGLLHSNGFVRFNNNQPANLFDLSAIPNQIGHSHYNYTDLVSENVVLDSVLIEVSKGGQTETFQIDMRQVNGSRMQMMANTVDSGIRAALVNHTIKLDANSKTVTGEKTQLLASCTATDFLRVFLRCAVQINLKYSDTEGVGHVSAQAYNIDGAEIDSAVSTMLQGLTISLKAYSLDARYSEENLRKSNLAIRYHVRTFDFEIPNGRNILVDYSFEEELPEFLMSLVTEATSLGQDHRGIDIIIKELMHVYDITNLENQDPNFRQRLEKIGFQYVAGQLVRPVVYLNTIDLENVDTIRSGDMLGDIRSYVEWELLNLVSLFYQNSFYKHQLRPGEAPVFKVFTSAVILENLLSIPHYHNHLNVEEKVDGTTIEFRRVLPNGTVLDCVTCTYNYMRDKIVMIPYREKDPEDVLNWGHNWDFGTFIAHYNPQLENAANKRMFSNSRTLPTPTNPSGIYLDVKGISKIIDMFQVTNPTTSKLPQPSEVTAG